jgi:hypothetical protein
VKARINLYRDPREQPTLAQQCALLAGHRPDVSVMNQALNFLPKDTTQEEYQQAKDDAAKITDLGQVELLGDQNTPKKTIRKFRNDLTPYSLGVLADVRKGGLKRDLSSIFEMSASPMTVVLPPDYLNKGLYQSTHGITGNSDPKWRALASYYNLFKNITNINTSPTYSQPPPASLPLPSVGSPPTQPTGFSPVPVVAKMQVIFSMVARNNHWGGPNDTKIHLMFTPLVTLHNPQKEWFLDRLQRVQDEISRRIPSGLHCLHDPRKHGSGAHDTRRPGAKAGACQMMDPCRRLSIP